MKKDSSKKDKKNLKKNQEEEQLFSSLRVKTWQGFLGQKKIKNSLKIAMTAAKKRKEQLEHVLLYGPPGLGKTTLAHLITREMESDIRVTSGPAIERTGDLASILTNLEQNDVLFIDEVHRLNKSIEEALYPAMEDFALDIVIGKGPSARIVRLDLPKFTIVGATTRIGLISSPLRDRFGVVHRLKFYNPDELAIIIKKAAEKLSVKIDDLLTVEIAKRARGTPRIALKLLKRVRDVAQVQGDGNVTKELLDEAFTMLDVDAVGLDDADRLLLSAIIDKHAGGPVGIETLAATISEDVGTIQDVIEPYLMKIGFLKRTPRGRVVTPHAFKHLSRTIPKSYDQQILFSKI